MFKKIKSLFKKTDKDRIPSPNDTAKEVQNSTINSTENPNTLATKPQLPPITSDIMAWLDRQGWKYDHREPDEGSTHHLIMGFTDREEDWTCVFRINEGNQLVTVFGILDDGVPVSHYTAILMELAKVNMNVSFGSIELDPNDGEVRAKIAFDMEFGVLSDRSLGSYLQALAGLTEVARGIIKTVMMDDEPSQFAGDYIELGDEVSAVIDDEKRTFFLATHTAQ